MRKERGHEERLERGRAMEEMAQVTRESEIIWVRRYEGEEAGIIQDFFFRSSFIP